MSENILNALVKLFALIADIHDETIITGREKEIVRSFLSATLIMSWLTDIWKNMRSTLVSILLRISPGAVSGTGSALHSMP